MLIDELETMLTEELSMLDLHKRLKIPPTSIVIGLDELYQRGKINIFLGPDKEIRYKLKQSSI